MSTYTDSLSSGRIGNDSNNILTCVRLFWHRTVFGATWSIQRYIFQHDEYIIRSYLSCHLISTIHDETSSGNLFK